MRTRNSSNALGPDDSTLEHNPVTTRVNNDVIIEQEHQPLLPPPTNTRTQPGRRPPPPGPPPPQHPPPQPPSVPPTTRRPSERYRPSLQLQPVSQPGTQAPQDLTNNSAVTSPRLSPTRIRQPPSSPQQVQPARPSPVTQHLSPSEPRRVAPPLNEVVLHRSMNWILQVRVPQLPPQPIRKIYMTTHSNMDVMTLSNCLQQCLNYYPNNNNNNNIAGLFCETTRTFYSLQHILSWDNAVVAEQQQYIYAVEIPLGISSNQEEESGGGFLMGWYRYIIDEISALFHSILSNLHILLPIVFAILFYYQYNIVSDSILLTYTTVYNTMIEQPLRDIYHYGPWFIGWEGDDISTICARITYHGDAQFWLRNMSECERIYAAKEQAFIRIVLPFIYIVGTVLFVYTIRFLVQEYQNYHFQLYNNNRNPLERDMADLYHSFHVILRQILQVHNNQQRPPSQQKNRPK